MTLSLVATDAGDGNEHDFVVWRQPAARRARPPGPALCRTSAGSPATWRRRRERLFAETAKYLDASAEAEADGQGQVDVARPGPETRPRCRRACGLARLPRHRPGRRR